MGDRLEVSVYLKDGLTEQEKDFLLSPAQGGAGRQEGDLSSEGRGAGRCSKKS